MNKRQWTVSVVSIAALWGTAATGIAASNPRTGNTPPRAGFTLPPISDTPIPTKPCGTMCGLVVVEAESKWDSESDKTSILAECPVGKKVIGGGAIVYELGYAPRKVALVENGPTSIGPNGPDAWVGGASEMNPTNEKWMVRVTAFCVNAD